MHRTLAFLLLIFSLPLWPFLYPAVKLTSHGPFIFKQKRMGKGMKVFTIYKIRTMVENAEKLKRKYKHFNEAEEPVFKIRNDPRYTGIGKWLAHTGLDELPQLINVLKGEMTLVGPRPLPVDEAKKIPRKYQKRFTVLPGITSLWVRKGAHKLSFEEWMELDLFYIKKRSFYLDMIIFLSTIALICKFIILQSLRKSKS